MKIHWKDGKNFSANFILFQHFSKINYADYIGQYDNFSIGRKKRKKDYDDPLVSRLQESVKRIKSDREMGALLATRCQLYSDFKFLGNNIKASQTLVYGLKREMPDTLYNKEDPLLMALVRQDSLSLPERATYDRYYAEQGQTDTLQNEKKHWTETGFWNFVGDNMLNKITC